MTLHRFPIASRAPTSDLDDAAAEVSGYPTREPLSPAEVDALTRAARWDRFWLVLGFVLARLVPSTPAGRSRLITWSLLLAFAGAIALAVRS